MEGSRRRSAFGTLQACLAARGCAPSTGNRAQRQGRQRRVGCLLHLLLRLFFLFFRKGLHYRAIDEGLLQHKQEASAPRRSSALRSSCRKQRDLCLYAVLNKQNVQHRQQKQRQWRWWRSKAEEQAAPKGKTTLSKTTHCHNLNCNFNNNLKTLTKNNQSSKNCIKIVS